MTPTLSIAHRELAAFYRLPIGWVVTALYLLLAGIVFTLSLNPGEPATLRDFFNLSGWLVMLVAPAVSMRLYSEELRSGSIEPLMTAPVSDWQVAIGKYIGGCVFLLSMLAPTLVFVAVLEGVSNPELGPIASGYLGLALLGMLLIAIGQLFSAATASQTVAFLATIFFLLLLQMATTLGAAQLGEPFSRPLLALAIAPRLADFAKGVIDTSHIVFFAALSAWFVALSVVVVEFRRWR